MFQRKKPKFADDDAVLTPERAEKRFHAALKTASNIIGYAECSPAKLREKLAVRGYESFIIEDVIERLTAAGLMDEDAICARRAEYLFRAKGYGPRRLPPALRQLGFSSAAVNGLVFDEENFDFAGKCLALAEKYGIDDEKKTVAHLARYGYTSGQIVGAIRALKAMQEEEQ